MYGIVYADVTNHKFALVGDDVDVCNKNVNSAYEAYIYIHY